MPVAYFDLLISSKWSLVERGRPEEVRLATKGGEKGGAKKGAKKLANLSRKISACHLKKNNWLRNAVQREYGTNGKNGTNGNFPQDLPFVPLFPFVPHSPPLFGSGSSGLGETCLHLLAVVSLR
jgi:hypothetical protein